MLKTTKLIVAIAATSLAVPFAIAQTMSSDQQVITPKPVQKMTPEQKKADKEAKRKAAAAPAPAGKAVVSSDQQVVTPKAAPKMTAEEKKADKAAKRTGVAKEEQKQQAKTLPGG